MAKGVNTFTIEQGVKMGNFAAVSFVISWIVGTLAAATTALNRDYCIILLELSAGRTARQSRPDGEARSDHHDTSSVARQSIHKGCVFQAESECGKHNATLSAPGISARMCDNFQEGTDRGTEKGQQLQQHRHRMLQDTSCPMDLLQSVQDDVDGFLSLNEYSLFFVNRYYRRCDTIEIELDPSTGVSMAQIETFNSLSCLFCFGDMGTPLSSLPDCCLARNARISVTNPLASTFTRICNEARATAIDDCGYGAVIETPSPKPGSPMASPSLVSPPATRPVMAPLLQTPVAQTCIRGLVEADTQPSDSLLDRTEFTKFLENQYSGTCISKLSSDLRDGVFLQLACAWCLSGTDASLECCSGSAARISIAAALDNTADHASSSMWLQRVCSTVMVEIGQACDKKSEPVPTRVPPVPVQQQPEPAAPPVMPGQPTAAGQTDIPVTSSPVALFTSAQPATNSLEQPTSIPIPTPEPTLRPPPGDPVSVSATAVPVQLVTFAPVSDGDWETTNAPTQSTTLAPFAAEPPVAIPPTDVPLTSVAQPPPSPGPGKSGCYVRNLDVFIWMATMIFSALCC